MNVGVTFEQEGQYTLLAKLDCCDVLQKRRFASLSQMILDLQVVGSPFEDVVDFCVRGELRELPGPGQAWADYFGQERLVATR